MANLNLIRTVIFINLATYWKPNAGVHLQRTGIKGLIQRSWRGRKVYKLIANTHTENAAVIAAFIATGNSLYTTVGFILGDVLIKAGMNNPYFILLIVKMIFYENSYTETQSRSHNIN